MLQRAANNAYSWWWASHVRTKQSKWLEQSLQDMEEKVHSMLKLIEEDGDSFAKRAEMYYKRRPELIHSVEESYRAFRALADRYDHLSKELQNANRAIATVFPEQVQFAMDEDEDCASPKLLKSSQVPAVNNVPKVPKEPIKDLNGHMKTALKQFQIKKSSKGKNCGKGSAAKSGVSKDAAVQQIDQLQKEILALQTSKEFVKSSYESGLSRYWEIENQIMEMQQKVCSLQDEFSVDAVIDDDEARTLMAGAALKSCEEKLAELQEKQEKSTRDAREEFKKIESARQHLKSLRHATSLHHQTGEQKPKDAEKSPCSTVEMRDGKHRTKVTEATEVKTTENLELSSMGSITASEMAEKIDKLVNKVISLEAAVSTQTLLINSLKTEAGELHEQIQSLEDEKETLIDGKQDLSMKVQQLEAKLNDVQDLNKKVEKQNNSLQTNFTEARLNLEHLSEKLSSVEPDTTLEQSDSSQDDVSMFLPEENMKHEIKDQENVPMPSPQEGKNRTSSSKETSTQEVKELNVDVKLYDTSAPEKEVTFLDKKPEEKDVTDHSHDCAAAEAQETEKEEGLNWQQMLLCGMEDREKILLQEYTEILRNFKDVKRKLIEAEKREKDSQFDTILQMREAKKAIVNRDDEIQRLRQRLNLLQGNESQAESKDFVENANNRSKEEQIKLIFVERTPSISAVEEKLRAEIDAILDENLDFWLRFCTAFHQIQKFKTQVQDLQDEISKLEEKKKQGGSVTTRMKSEVMPIYKHLREIHTELTLWLEQSVPLKDELKRRLASLCCIQEKITKALKDGAEEEEITFSSHQAAKFQGEILNMKQENNKVREELETGLDHVGVLQLAIEKTLRMLNEDYGICTDQPQLKQSMTKSRIPLRSFIFGMRQRKPKHSLFSYMHPNRRYHIMRSGVPMTNPSS